MTQPYYKNRCHCSLRLPAEGIWVLCPTPLKIKSNNAATQSLNAITPRGKSFLSSGRERKLKSKLVLQVNGEFQAHRELGGRPCIEGAVDSHFVAWKLTATVRAKLNGWNARRECIIMGEYPVGSWQIQTDSDGNSSIKTVQPVATDPAIPRQRGDLGQSVR